MNNNKNNFNASNSTFSIKSKLILLLLMVTLIPTAIVSLISLHSLQTQKQIEIEETRIALAQSVASETRLYVKGMEDMVRGLASLDQVQDFSNLEAQRQILEQFRTAYHDVSLFITVDAEGRLQSKAPNLPVNDNFAQEEWFNAVKGTGTIYTSKRSQVSTQGLPLITIACPVMKDDEFAGAVVAQITLNSFANITENLTFGNTGNTYIIDANRIYITHPNLDLVYNRHVFEAPIVEEAVNNGWGFGEYLMEGRGNVTSYVEVPGLDWFVFASQEKQEAFQEMTAAKNKILMTVIISLAVVILISVVASNSISKPIQQLTNVAGSVANGNLQQRVFIKNKDELGQLSASFNFMITDLKKLIGKLQLAIQEIASSSEELSAASQQVTASNEEVTASMHHISNSAEQQNEGIHQIATSVNNMANWLNTVADNTTNASKSAAEVNTTAADGKEVINKTIDQMKIIDNTVSTFVNQVASLDEKSNNISNIVTTISAIAEQTNLLALNAAIEAARAGDAGKGFAVVADEVRKLAEQSSTAAEEISELILSIQDETRNTVIAMNAGKTEVEKGIDIVGQAESAFNNINTNINAVSNIMRDIAGQVHHVSQSSQDIVTAVDNMANISHEVNTNSHQAASATEEQNASMEEVASSANKLAQLAQQLQDEVNKFTT